MKQKKIGGFVRNLFILLNGQHGAIHSVLDSCVEYLEQNNFFLTESLKQGLENTTQFEKNHYIKDNMGQIVLTPIRFLKCI